MNVFIVTSAFLTQAGVFNSMKRFNDTLDTLKSIRNKDSTAMIFLADISAVQIMVSMADELQKYCKIVSFNDHHAVKMFSSHGMKSHGETIILMEMLNFIKRQGIVCDRIFKLTGRYVLDDGFDILYYADKQGHYVFKRRNETWMNPVISGATHCLDTRLFSLCSSLSDDYFDVLQKNLGILGQLDTEHVHFLNIPKDKLIEVDRVYCTGRIARTGELIHD
jgi:hypothetical protein